MRNRFDLQHCDQSTMRLRFSSGGSLFTWGSGRIRVGTAAGVATSGSDFAVSPRPYAAADVATTGTIAVNGASVVASVPTSGQVSLLWFSGTKGQRLSLGLTGSSFASDFTVAIYSPYGGSLARDLFGAPWLGANLFGGLALPVLPSSGTYQIVIDPVGTGTGSVTATLSTRVTGSLSFTGAGSTVTLGRAGQQAELTFAVTAGQRIGIGHGSSGQRRQSLFLAWGKTFSPAG
ncbi:MAG TPA: hypothetical protein VFC19_15310 [Candidatus Limnocylindrales bacterium]|nr:hypothetical protein [Candidatus Limnocylindrales bacterium]